MKAITVKDYKIEIKNFDAIVVGSGAAGFNAANRLYEAGLKNIVLITENKNAGTSRNTGSDKQTYYKLTLEGSQDESIQKMAKVLFDGGAMHGDHALVEAANSVRSFINLVELGVDFPTSIYGEYIGYKTDHDPNERGTSVGPLTSKRMTESLEKRAALYNIPIDEFQLVIKLLENNGKIRGLITWDTKEEDIKKSIKIYLAPFVIMATGGPAGIYEKTVFPHGHHGSSGICFEIGTVGNNLTEWQYGLGSLRPRWNLSGTYMQALPSIYSVDENGEKVFFIENYFEDSYDGLNNIFLKGYQWPFDVYKLKNGSSIIDILIFHENQILERKVYIDFRKNPFSLEEIEFEKLSDEAYSYIKEANGIGKLPIERLKQMNMPAYEFYKNRGVDLEKEAIEVAINPQHNNGGLAVNAHWETNIEGLFACGEVAGTHGVSRPGGSALNSGQVGSLRAAQEVSRRFRKSVNLEKDFLIKNYSEDIEELVNFIENNKKEKSNIMSIKKEYQSIFNKIAGPIRNNQLMEGQLEKIKNLLENFEKKISYNSKVELKNVFIFRDLLLSQYLYLAAMIDYKNLTKDSRGSALYIEQPPKKDSYYTYLDFSTNSTSLIDKIQEIKINKDLELDINWIDRREIPSINESFEVQWENYRRDREGFKS